MEKKQTAVEWLEDQWGNAIHWNWEEIKQWFEQAKEMEKEQIEDAFNYGHNEGCSYMYGGDSKSLTSEQYYNETYGNQTDRS